MQTSTGQRGFEYCLGIMERKLPSIDFAIRCMAFEDPKSVRAAHLQMIQAASRIQNPDLKARFLNIVSVFDAVASAMGY